MQKLVYLFRHKKPVAVGIKDYGVIYPKIFADTMPIEPIPGRPVVGLVYDWDYVHQINLKSEQADELPESLREDADPDFIREYKLSQARQIAENIRFNEVIVREIKKAEADGLVEAIGRAIVDVATGQVIHKKDREKAVIAPEPADETPTETEATIEVPQVKRGRKPKAESKTE